MAKQEETILKHWKKIRSGVSHDNPWWCYRLDGFEIPGGYRGEYHYVHTNGSSLIVALTAEDRLVMVRQYRYLCDRESIEFPCGSVKQGSSYLETAHLELAEETGYRAASIESAGAFNPYNGVTDEICQVFMARQLAPAPARPDATEEFEVLLLSPPQLDALIAERVIWDGMTLAAWAMLRGSLCPTPQG